MYYKLGARVGSLSSQHPLPTTQTTHTTTRTPTHFTHTHSYLTQPRPNPVSVRRRAAAASPTHPLSPRRPSEPLRVADESEDGRAGDALTCGARHARPTVEAGRGKGARALGGWGRAGQASARRDVRRVAQHGAPLRTAARRLLRRARLHLLLREAAEPRLQGLDRMTASLSSWMAFAW